MCRLLPRKVLSSYYQRVSESEKDGENEREGQPVANQLHLNNYEKALYYLVTRNKLNSQHKNTSSAQQQVSCF